MSGNTGYNRLLKETTGLTLQQTPKGGSIVAVHFICGVL
jgi:hypothetical protein